MLFEQVKTSIYVNYTWNCIFSMLTKQQYREANNMTSAIENPIGVNLNIIFLGEELQRLKEKMDNIFDEKVKIDIYSKYLVYLLYKELLKNKVEISKTNDELIKVHDIFMIDNCEEFLKEYYLNLSSMFSKNDFAADLANIREKKIKIRANLFIDNISDITLLKVINDNIIHNPDLVYFIFTTDDIKTYEKTNGMCLEQTKDYSFYPINNKKVSGTKETKKILFFLRR